MTGQDRKHNLLAARKLVEKVAADMNVSAHRCPNCDMLKRENFAEFQAAEELGAICRKLQRFAKDPRICEDQPCSKHA